MDSDDVVARALAGCRRAHRRLLARVQGLTDEAARAPSSASGWTRGHVLTHLARNADSHVRMLRGALAHEHLEQYAGGMGERAAAIEDGAQRPAVELVGDVARSAAALEGIWDAMTPDAWEGFGRSDGRPWPCRALPMQRWREVEVHHVDLGLGYEIDDWPADYVEMELMNLASEHEAARLVGWIMGRTGAPDSARLRPWTSRD